MLVRASVREKYPADSLLGCAVSGRYLIVDVLGAGGMGAVYLALQEPIRREVALKVIKGEAARDADVRNRFFREARAVAALTSDHCVRLFDYGEDEGGLLYMVLELVRGRTLKQVLREEGTLSPARTIEIGIQVADALAEAHGADIVHRDLKPENIMLLAGPGQRAGREKVKVLDFGVAKVMRGDVDEPVDSVHTRAGMVLGTPRYMAPEQAGSRGPGPASDQYSLGIVLWELLTGRPPFTGATAFDTLTAHARDPLPTIDPALRVPEGLVRVLYQVLAKAPEDRYSNVEALGEALAALKGGADVHRTGEVEGLNTEGVEMSPESTSREFAASMVADDPAIPYPGEGVTPPEGGTHRWMIPVAVALAGLMVVGAYTMRKASQAKAVAPAAAPVVVEAAPPPVPSAAVVPLSAAAPVTAAPAPVTAAPALATAAPVPATAVPIPPTAAMPFSAPKKPRPPAPVSRFEPL